MGVFNVPLVTRVFGNSRACVRRRLGLRRGDRGEGPCLICARLVRCVVEAGSRWRWRFMGMEVVAVWGMVEVVGAA